MNDKNEFNRNASIEYITRLIMQMTPEERDLFLQFARKLAGQSDERASA